MTLKSKSRVKQDTAFVHLVVYCGVASALRFFHNEIPIPANSKPNVTVSECQASSSKPKIYGAKILRPIKIRMIESAGFR